MRPDYDLQRRGNSKISENLRQQSSCTVSVRVCTNQVGNLRTECTFSQIECSSIEPSYGHSKHLKAGHNRPASVG